MNIEISNPITRDSQVFHDVKKVVFRFKDHDETFTNNSFFDATNYISMMIVTETSEKAFNRDYYISKSW